MSFSSNFVFPIRDLESTRVRLTPFIPTLYAREFVDKTKRHPELFKHSRGGPFDSVDDFTESFLEPRIFSVKEAVLFAILDKTGETPSFAGIIGLRNTNVVDQSTEIGMAVVLPEHQRTHVTSNAIGLLLHYCLELPAKSVKAEQQFKYGPGLGLRRVQWRAFADNSSSVRTAERMGFRREVILRWQSILTNDKAGSAVPPEREVICKGPGRHLCMLSLCWDDWELEGAREVVQQQMDRLSPGPAK